ncbi:isochorismatase family protein [Mangrovibacter phragmitis]|uniref:isochorismatase family protein n=1 Tax=Mangrovibacter phragmitis TaxID=1691903 RepID=UPI0035178BE9
MVQQRVVMVVDMQLGVFATQRVARDICCQRINQLIDAAEQVIFIQHAEADMQPGTEAFEVLPELHQPTTALRVTKTACDAFWNTSLAQELEAAGITGFVVCGCATDYCVDATIKRAAGLGYRVTVAEDAHTTANRPAANAQVLIAHHNDVWRNFTVPGNPVLVQPVASILEQWAGA